MSSPADLLQILVSFFVEAGGQGVTRGGKGIFMSGMRKIGWAKGGGGGRGRLGGHSLGGHSLGSGGCGGGSDLSNYNPKEDLKQRQAASYNRGRRSGSDIIKRKGGSNRPAHLHGRSSFSGGQTLNGNSGSRWIRNSGQRQSATPRPRSFIKF